MVEKMKKIVALLLASFLLAMTFCACGEPSKKTAISVSDFTEKVREFGYSLNNDLGKIVECKSDTAKCECAVELSVSDGAVRQFQFVEFEQNAEAKDFFDNAVSKYTTEKCTDDSTQEGENYTVRHWIIDYNGSHINTYDYFAVVDNTVLLVNGAESAEEDLMKVVEALGY